jgi:Cof subfamily protein (haloacid dehalogenase superfamily)
MVKLICTDIDGTLLNKEREVDAYTIKVFGKLDKSIKVVLASSRMPKALFHIQQKLDIEAMPLICYNGALVLSSGGSFDLAKVLSSITIPVEQVKAMMDLAQASDVHVSIFQNNTWLISALDFYAQREINNTRVRPDGLLTDLSAEALNAFLENGAHKVMLMGQPELLDNIEKKMRDTAETAVLRSKDILLELTPKTDKSEGLEVLISKLPEFVDIKRENRMSFGDNYNDMELIKDAKYGIAVGNSVQALKDVAYAVTKPNKEHGVAFYVEQFFEQQE